MDADADAQADAAAVAQMMGFSAFGAQDRPQKKRRHNPGADAVTDAQAQQAQAEAQAQGVLTGSNSASLGPIRGAADARLTGADDAAVSAPATATGPAAQESEASSTAPVRPAGLPERPVPAAGFVGSSSSLGLPSRVQGRHPRYQDNASRGPTWYEGYYDPSSNENPWARLEQAMGLQPKGPWMPRENQSTAAAAAI